MSTPSRRRRLVPPSAIIAGAVILVLVAAAVTVSVMVAQSRSVVVPDVSGLPQDIAERALTVLGLSAEVGGTRVSVDVPEGAIVSQEPAAGAEVTRGSTVTLVVSAGPQTFLLPDVVGKDVEEARAELVSLGLVVNVVGVSAEASAGVVVEMFPSPGSSVNTGDEVRLSVPGGDSESELLLPYDVSGLRIVLDPAPPADADAGDPALEVARRVSALLQAAGAEVTMTRVGGGATPTLEERLAVTTEAGADLFVGLDVGRSGETGLRVEHHAAGGVSAGVLTASQALAAAVTRAARLPGLVVVEPRASQDQVMGGVAVTAVRVIVGDAAAEPDRARMTDPAWADSVARAVYRGIGTEFADR